MFCLFIPTPKLPRDPEINHPYRSSREWGKRTHDWKDFFSWVAMTGPTV